jgi:hypothetical protein
MKLVEPDLTLRAERWFSAPSIPLSAEQVSALSGAIAQVDPQGTMTSAEVLEVLRTPTTEQVTVRRDADWPSTREWIRGFQLPLVLGQRTDLPPQIQQKWIVLIPNLLTAYPDDYLYNPRTASTFNGMAALGVAEGIVTAEQVEAFRAQWETLVDREVPCPLDLLLGENGERLFGDGYALEPTDIEGCK